MASQPIYQFYSELAEYEPKIWRRFQVPANISFARLGYIVMTLYEMQANHSFSIDYPVNKNLAVTDKAAQDTSGKIIPFHEKLETYYRFEIPSTESFPSDEHHRIMDATTVSLRRLSSEPGLALSVMYDYGDGWEVELTLEKVFEDKGLPGRELPRVLEGEGYGIIENCGGPDGLAHLAEICKAKCGEEYEAISRWLGKADLDLVAFDIDDMNFRLKKVPRIYQELYEYDYAPTAQSIKILDRAYKKD